MPLDYMLRDAREVSNESRKNIYKEGNNYLIASKTNESEITLYMPFNKFKKICERHPDASIRQIGKDCRIISMKSLYDRVIGFDSVNEINP